QLSPKQTTITVRGKARAVLSFIERPPDNLVYADVAPAIARKLRRVRLKLPTVKGPLVERPTCGCKVQIAG
ncbi:MAG: hypothetical protein KC502_07155, partial [Myxococcales bacterium]|nr:hypothetical protein [Myxococcales bacterium]